MAYAMTKQGSLDNCVTYEFICDTVTDMNAIENKYRTIGTVAIVLKGENDGLEVYIAGSDKQWNNIGTMGAGSSSGSGNSSLSIHVCAQNEVSNGLPSVSTPDESTIYLVSSGNTTGNLYEEYIYVNSTWEKFGSASIDLSQYALVANPEFTGSISLGRKASTTVGTNSIAIGNNTTASGDYSQASGTNTMAAQQGAHAEGYGSLEKLDYWFATNVSDRGSTSSVKQQPGCYALAGHTEGMNTYATGGGGQHAEGYWCSATGNAGQHAEGRYTSASGDSAQHVEGYYTYAVGDYGQHAEGYYSKALGNKGSHAEGEYTVATSEASHAEGYYTTAQTGISAHAEGYQTTSAGRGSHAEGYGGNFYIDNTSYASGAFGDGDHAEGYYTKTGPSGQGKHAEGYYTMADAGPGSHAEGYHTQASETGAHAEGNYTIASGYGSHAEGLWTIANGYLQHVAGACNKEGTFPFPEWVAGTSYVKGDQVKVTTISDNVITVKGYECKTANSDNSFTASKWTETTQMKELEIIGNGTGTGNRSNARVLDWDGNEYLGGDIYVGCEADSTGGTKIARIPDPPTTDGTYTLQATVSSGTITYTWVAGA